MTRIFNPLVLRLAGRRHFAMAARVQHTGRRSGRSYLTPATARRAGGEIVMALTFGSQADWVRNILAAGQATIRLDGHTYEVAAPVLLNRSDRPAVARAAFNPVQRLFFVLLGIKQFMRMEIRSRE
jgi:deazaflavin-dependent oxidoreductase (nitroreductase family)